MLLGGKVWLQARGLRSDRTVACFDVLLVAIHDHRARFVGHHCLIEDRTRERLLEQQLREVNNQVPTEQAVRINLSTNEAQTRPAPDLT
jgi:hypothetical protein